MLPASPRSDVLLGAAGRVSGLEEDLRTVRQSLAKAETDKRHLHEKLTDLEKVKAAGGENGLKRLRILKSNHAEHMYECTF